MTRPSVLKCLQQILTPCLLAFAIANAAPEPVSTAWLDARQLILVVTPDWNANRGTLQAFDRTERGWRPFGRSAPVAVGRAGSAWGAGLHGAQPGALKREGDGRSPAGVFRVGVAFGYASTARTGLPYRAMSASDYCIDVPASPLYNTIVNAHDVGERAVAGSTEPMRLDIHHDGDQRYRLGFVVEHNPERVPGAGSCIFAHLWRAADEPTSGCTSMEHSTMRVLLTWLRADRRPIFILLPQSEYARLEAAWQLPEVSPEA
jgi:L,D-peptidoglycan transpeptidase YkuD (ErfK/YbiS/YcfS/YnhG family)